MRKCESPEEAPANHMLDGPGMVYTPENQTPFAGIWRDEDSIVVLEIENRGAYERSYMKASVNGEPAFEAEAWVYATGNIKLTQEHKDINSPEPDAIFPDWAAAAPKGWTCPDCETRDEQNADLLAVAYNR